MTEQPTQRARDIDPARNLDLAIARYEDLKPPPEPMTDDDLRKLADACRRARPKPRDDPYAFRWWILLMAATAMLAVVYVTEWLDF